MKIIERFFFLCVLVSHIRGNYSQAESPYEELPRVSVLVSILPQKYFVEKVGSPFVNLSVMIPPGQSHTTYEPSPRQLNVISSAHVYFTVGVPAEKAWLDSVSTINPKMSVIDTVSGAEACTSPSEASFDEHEAIDPHLWTDPLCVKSMASRIERALAQLDPANATFYRTNNETFQKELDELNGETQALFRSIKHKAFLVAHPSWGAFARRYGLEQISIEHEGKEPGPKYLSEVIKLAKARNIKTIVIQKQFSQKAAERIAQSLGAKIVTLDPLAYDYMANMREVAQTLAEVMR